MARKYFTLEEIQSIHLYEMPNMAYKAIIDALYNHFGVMTRRMVEIFNSAVVMQLDQFIDLYSIIQVI